MAVDNLADVKRYPLPEGYRIRRYQPGDDETWLRIHDETGFYDPFPPGFHATAFGGDEEALAERQLFIVDEATGEDVATATAWFNDPIHRVPGGRIHWVAVVPKVQGKGLAKALLTALCEQFEALGETTVYLTTDSENGKAIALYEGLGFRVVG